MAERILTPKQDVAPIDLDTLPKHFLARVREYGSNKIAMRKKRYGIWQQFTWHDSFQHVHDFSLGLVALGLQRGDKILIIGENDPEYYWAELAAHAAGMTTVGAFTDATPKEIQYIATNSDSVLAVAHDQEQVDKLLEIRDEIPQIQKVIYWEKRGLFNYHDEWLISFEDVEELGRQYGRQHPQAFDENVAAGKGDDYAIFSYTSGTTGLPKAAMITHANLLYGYKHTGIIQSLEPQDDHVSFSPMAWIAEQGLGLSCHLQAGSIVNFPEKPETVQYDIREIAPHTLLFAGRLWESLVSRMQASIADTNWLNRKLYEWFMPVGYKTARLTEEGKTPGLWLRFLYFLGEIAIFAPMRDKMGLRRIRYAYTSGSAVSPEVIRFFRALKIQLLQLYGSTECQTHTLHYVDDVKPGTVGMPPPGVQVKVVDTGEIAVKSRSVFVGYYKAPDKTAEVLRDGWFYTGDAGYIDDDGHLVYLERMSDMRELSDTEKFSPQFIEARLKFSQYIQDVMTIGSREMPYVTALITLNFDNTARWGEKRGLSFTTMTDLSQKPQIYDLIEQEIVNVNQSLPPASRIRKFAILYKTFDADEAELTRTRKLKRKNLEQRYGDIIYGMYEGLDKVPVQAEVTYQDGRKGVTETEVYIRNVGDVSDLAILKRVASA